MDRESNYVNVGHNLIDITLCTYVLQIYYISDVPILRNIPLRYNVTKIFDLVRNGEADVTLRVITRFIFCNCCEFRIKL